jgi:drug/metabolite transporter superfamily protein YnfA
MLVVAAVSYLADLLAAFLVPDVARQSHAFLIIAPAIAEIWMVLYLLVKGVRSSDAVGRAPAAAGTAVPIAAG